MQLFCAPHYPDKEPYALAVILHHLDYSITRSAAEPCDAAVLWQDETFLAVPQILRDIAESKPVININCLDISKRRVEAVFRNIFGLSTFVDPQTFVGKCIKKPDGNAVRHGLVVECPQRNDKKTPRHLDIESTQPADLQSAAIDWVYQRIIETRINGLQIEYRTPVILGEIPLVYVSERDYPTADIRDCKRHKLTPTPTEKVFSSAEIENILTFSQTMGMDLGELDIMRSVDDNNIYIIDANKTAAGFGLENRACWSPGDRKRVVAVLAEVFERNLKTLIRHYRQ